MSRFLAVLFLGLVQAFSAHAQLTRGFVSGTVQDASGSVVSGVQIRIINVATGLDRQTATNEAGVYRFAAVEPGTYELVFSKEGFETAKVAGIQVGTSQEVVLNRSMVLAAVATTVEITETPPGVELAKSTPTIGQTLSQELVESIPTTAGARDVTRLALLAPTVVRGTGSNEFSANGQRARNNNFTIDGVDNNDASVTLPASRIIPEMVGEFQVQTNAYSAEFGRNSGAQVSVITRAGTNLLHGEVFDYYAGQWMEPLTVQDKRAGLTDRPRFNQNQAGGALGGPIQKDKTFYFVLLEANRRREAPSPDNATTITIPTPEGYAALPNVPLAANQPAQSRQTVLGAMSFLPEIHSIIPRYDNPANVNINGVPIQVGSARIPLARPHDFWYAVSRVDHQLTSRDTLSYRSQFDNRNQPNVSSNLGFGDRFAGGQTIMAQSHAMSHIHTFGANLVNEFRFSFSRRNLDFPENDAVSPTVGITGAFVIGGGNGAPQSRVQNTFQYQNIATYLFGRHSFKVGGDVRRVQLYDLTGFDSKGTWTFNSLADFMNNNAFNLRRALPPAQSDTRQNLLFFFFQDDYKVTKDLTVNLGLRYEYTSFPAGFFGATDPAVLAAGVPGPAKGDKNNWAPRFGLAYSPSNTTGFLNKLLGDGQTVFRGGYGVGYDVIYLNLITNTSQNYPNSFVENQFNLVNVYPNFPPPLGSSLNPLALFANAPEDAQNPTAHFYSFSIQRQIARSFITELGYAGSRSYHQIRQGEANPGILTPEQAELVRSTRNPNAIPNVQARRLNPAWGSRIRVETSANANYNAMFLRLDKRMANGLIFGMNYTWSKLMSDNDEALGVANLADSSPAIPQDYRNMGPEWAVSAFDRTHRFVFHYNYTTPWFTTGALDNAVLRTAFRDWSLSGFSEWQSGQPFSIRTGVDSVGNGRTDAGRPDYNPNGILTLDPVEGNYRTFTSPIDGSGKFVTPLTAGGLPLQFTMPFGGNLGRNTLRGPSFTNWNFSLAKTFSLTERLKLRLRNDFINLFNHRNYGPPENRLVSPAFGQNTRGQVGQANRTMLLSAKIVW